MSSGGSKHLCRGGGQLNTKQPPTTGDDARDANERIDHTELQAHMSEHTMRAGLRA